MTFFIGGLKMKIVLILISLFFTGYGLFLFGRGDMTNGFLSLIMGELVDLRFLGNKSKKREG